MKKQMKERERGGENILNMLVHFPKGSVKPG